MTTKAAESVDLSLTLFGGLDTSLKATDLPEGLSPQNNDVIFGPGFVASRPCASKVFQNPFTNAPRVVSEHEFVQANQQPLNLYLDSLGVLRQEDPTNSPGTYTQIGIVVPGSIMKAVTFDGVDYQVFSDGIHGIDVPRAYDGTNWDRLTQDGPGAAPLAADLLTTVNIAGANGIVAQFAAVNIASGNETGTLVTLVTATPHGFFAGEQIVISGVAVAGYNLTLSIQSVPDSTSLTYIAGAGLVAVGAGGTVQPTSVVVTTTTPHGMIAGAQFKIVGNSQAIYNNTTVGNAPTWPVQTVISPTTFVFVCGAAPVVGINGTATTGGQVSVGGHQAVCFFIFRSGAFSKPSPIAAWSASGGKQVHFSSIPIGPSNVIARGFAFTGTGGDNFFHIPLAANGAMASIVNDNTSTTASFDFSDNTLFSAEGIDIPGNNLFDLVTLAPCLGIDSYASRLFVWGEFNKVQAFINMGFEGGTAAVGGINPLGWTIGGGGGGALVSAPSDAGMAWQITGDGTPNPLGQISQTAYQDEFFQAILEPSTQYSFYVWAQPSAAGIAGTLRAVISSASTGFTATAAIAVNLFPGQGKFLSADFKLVNPLPTPAVIPSDLLLTISAVNLPNAATLTIDEMMMVFTEQPYRDTEMRGSYVNDPEAFDGETGTLGPESDPNPIRDTFQLLEQFTILTSQRRHVTRDNDAEPGTWQVTEVEAKVGAASVHSTTTGPNWAMWISDNGKSLSVRITSSGESFKISREMKTDFGAVNMNAKHKTWITNVDDDSRVYIGLPQGNAVTPSAMAVLDYFESDTAQDIAGNRPLKIGFTGKMLTTDLGRKWTMWKLPMDCGEVLSRGNGIRQFVVGSGAGVLGSFGNAYIFDPAKLTDDDYGGMLPQYMTYFFVNHEMEMQLPVGSRRKLYSASSTFITGVGSLILTPHVNRVGNVTKQIIDPAKPWVLTQDLADDLEWTGMDVTARRMALLVAVAPLANTTDVQFVLSHLGVSLQKHPVSPQAGINRGSP